MDAGGPPVSTSRSRQAAAPPAWTISAFRPRPPKNSAPLAGRLKAAGARHVDQADAHCCYARGDKTWVFDPEGVAWETFHTTGAITRYGEDLGPETGTGKPATDERIAASAPRS